MCELAGLQKCTIAHKSIRLYCLTDVVICLSAVSDVFLFFWTIKIFPKTKLLSMTMNANVLSLKCLRDPKNEGKDCNKNTMEILPFVHSLRFMN